MGNKHIIQNGRTFERQNGLSFEAGSSRVGIPSVAGNLTCTLAYTAPFDGVIDETGEYWQLGDHYVKYGLSNITLNLYEVFDKRNLIKTPSKISANTGSGSKDYSRYPESDSDRGFAWRNGNEVIFTAAPLAATGIPWYTDPTLKAASPGNTTGSTNPELKTGYSYSSNSWQAVFSLVPHSLTYTVVKTGTYTATNQANL